MHCAIGVINEELKFFIHIPYSKQLFSRIKSEQVHINVLELIALFLGYVLFLVEYKSNPSVFPPAPQVVLWGDNMSANKWFQTFSTNLLIATKTLQLFAEYMKDSQVSANPQHIPGKLNVEADGISRVQELCSPHKQFVYDISYKSLLLQVLRSYNNLRSFRLFLPSREMLSDLSMLLTSGNLMEELKRRKCCGRFVPVDYIFSGSATSTNSCTSYFL